LLYTRIRKSPYFHASRQHGVRRYSVYNHTYHPRHYGDPVREYLGAAGGRDDVWDVGVERQIVARHLSWLPNVAPDEYGQIV